MTDVNAVTSLFKPVLMRQWKGHLRQNAHFHANFIIISSWNVKDYAPSLLPWRSSKLQPNLGSDFIFVIIDITRVVMIKTAHWDIINMPPVLSKVHITIHVCIRNNREHLSFDQRLLIPDNCYWICIVAARRVVGQVVFARDLYPYYVTVMVIGVGIYFLLGVSCSEGCPGGRFSLIRIESVDSKHSKYKFIA